MTNIIPYKAIIQGALLSRCDKNRLKRREVCNTYLTHVCRQPGSIERSERRHRKQEHSVNTLSFISFRSRLTIMLAGAAREKAKWGYQMLILGDCLDWSKSWYAASNWRWHQGVCLWCGWTSIPEKGADGIWCGWVLVGQSSR